MDFYSRYKLGNLLGKGSYGEVYKIKEKSTGKSFVAKFINKRILFEKGVAKVEARFKKEKHDNVFMLYKRMIWGRMWKALRREVEILKRVGKIPGTISYVGYYQSVVLNGDDNFVIVMTLAEGISLRKMYNCFISLKKKIPFYILLNIFVQLSKTLSLLHENNIVHRDIKMDNAILDKNKVTLIDFGFSCVPDLKINRAIKCNTTSTYGSPAYKAPEIVKREEKLDNPYDVTDENIEKLKNVDVWALGVLMSSLNDLQLPFRGPTEHFVNKSILRNVRKPSEYNNPKFNAIINSTLQEDPNKRPTAKEIYEELIKLVE